MSPKFVALQDITDFMNDAQVSFGLPRPNAELITRAVLDGELRGHSDHGVFFFPYVFRNHIGGGIKKDPQISILSQSKLAVRVDNDGGYGVLGMSRATDEAIGMAKENGMALGIVTNTSNVVALAPFVQRAVDQGLLAMAGSGARLPFVPPVGGLEGVFSTNPFAFGAPAGNHPHYLFDAAMSAVAGAKVLEAGAAGQLIEPGLVEDLEGKPITNPSGLRLNEMLLLPMAGIKGYGFAMMVDIMSTVLSGDDRWGHFIWLLDVEQLMLLDEFKSRMDTDIERIKSVARKPGVDEIFYPGEQGQRRMQKIMADGFVPLDGAAWSAIESVGTDYDVPLPEVHKI